MGLARLAIIVCLAGSGRPTAPAPRPPDHVGYAVMYAEHVMEGRAAAHDPLYKTAPAPCYVAYTLARDSDMARLWLRVQGPTGTLDCLVVDLPDDGRGHRQPLIDRQVWVELGWPSRWICGKGWTGRARDCRVKVWVLNGSSTVKRRKPSYWPMRLLSAPAPHQRNMASQSVRSGAGHHEQVSRLQALKKSTSACWSPPTWRRTCGP